MTKEPLKDTIKVHQAAKRLKYSESRIYQLLDEGKLSGIKRYGQIFLFEASVEKFMQEHCEEV